MPKLPPVSSLTPLPSQPEEVTVTFTGDALEVLRKLRDELGVETEQDAVLQGVRLLVSAVGKEVLLRQGNKSEVLRLWK